MIKWLWKSQLHVVAAAAAEAAAIHHSLQRSRVQ